VSLLGLVILLSFDWISPFLFNSPSFDVMYANCQTCSCHSNFPLKFPCHSIRSRLRWSCVHAGWSAYFFFRFINFSSGFIRLYRLVVSFFPDKFQSTFHLNFTGSLPVFIHHDWLIFFWILSVCLGLISFPFHPFSPFAHLAFYFLNAFFLSIKCLVLIR